LFFINIISEHPRVELLTCASEFPSMCNVWVGVFVNCNRGGGVFAEEDTLAFGDGAVGDGVCDLAGDVDHLAAFVGGNGNCLRDNVHRFSLHFFDYADTEEFCQAVGDGFFG